MESVCPGRSCAGSVKQQGRTKDRVSGRFRQNRSGMGIELVQEVLRDGAYCDQTGRNPIDIDCTVCIRDESFLCFQIENI